MSRDRHRKSALLVLAGAVAVHTRSLIVIALAGLLTLAGWVLAILHRPGRYAKTVRAVGRSLAVLGKAGALLARGLEPLRCLLDRMAAGPPPYDPPEHGLGGFGPGTHPLDGSIRGTMTTRDGNVIHIRLRIDSSAGPARSVAQIIYMAYADDRRKSPGVEILHGGRLVVTTADFAEIARSARYPQVRRAQILERLRFARDSGGSAVGRAIIDVDDFRRDHPHADGHWVYLRGCEVLAESPRRAKR